MSIIAYLSVVCHQLVIEELDVFVFSHLALGLGISEAVNFYGKKKSFFPSVGRLDNCLTRVMMLLSSVSSSSFLTLIVYWITSPSCKTTIIIITVHSSLSPWRHCQWSWWSILGQEGRHLRRAALLGGREEVDQKVTRMLTDTWERGGGWGEAGRIRS